MKKLVLLAVIAAVLSGCSNRPPVQAEPARVSDIMERTRSLIQQRQIKEEYSEHEYAREEDRKVATSQFQADLQQRMQANAARLDIHDDHWVLWLPERVTFEFDDVAIEQARTVKALAAFVGNMGDEYFVRVIGHTDNPGTDEYNFKLGLRRASEVARALIDEGVPAENIILGSKGAGLQRLPSEDRQRVNRRVEFEIIKAAP